MVEMMRLKKRMSCERVIERESGMECLGLSQATQYDLSIYSS